MKTHKKNKLCFVIMPFSKTANHPEMFWAEHFEHFLKIKICNAYPGIDVKRSRLESGQIAKNIIENLIYSDVVVADITDSNPNVFWELGIRHSFKHGTVIIAEEGTKFPFDISPIAIHSYRKTSKLSNREFINEADFSGAIKNCANNPNISDSIVLETISGRGSLWFMVHKEEIIKRLDSLLIEIYYNQRTLKQLGEKLKNREYFYDWTFLYSSIDYALNSGYVYTKEFYKTGLKASSLSKKLNQLLQASLLSGEDMTISMDVHHEFPMVIEKYASVLKLLKEIVEKELDISKKMI